MQTAFAFGLAKNVNGRPGLHRAASAYQLGGRVPSSSAPDGNADVAVAMPLTSPTSNSLTSTSSLAGNSSNVSASKQDPLDNRQQLRRQQSSDGDRDIWRRSSGVDKTNPFIGYFQMSREDPTSPFAGADGVSSSHSVSTRGPSSTNAASSSRSTHHGRQEMPFGPYYYSAAFFAQQKKFAEWLSSQSIKIPSFFRRESCSKTNGKPPKAPAPESRGKPSITHEKQFDAKGKEAASPVQTLKIDTEACVAESVPVCSPPAPPCSRIAQDFEILGPLGQGGQGSVFKARSKVDGCHYAIKKVALAKALRKDADTREQALREVKSMAAMPPHANVVRYHTSWIEEDSNVNMDVMSTTSVVGSVAASSLSNNGGAPDQTMGFSFEESSLPPYTSYSNMSGGFDFVDPSQSTNLAEIEDPTLSRSPEVNDRRPSNASSVSSDEPQMTLYIQMELCGTSQRAVHPVEDEEFNLSMFFDRVKHEYGAITSSEMKETHSTFTAWLRASAEERASNYPSVKHAEGLKLFLGVVQGVQHIHQCGVIHRDLKPDNIFIDGNIAKIGDFGLSKSIFAEPYDPQSPREALRKSLADGSGNHTTALGTFTYASPEQLGHGHEKASTRVRSAKYSIKSDIFALGVVLLELCCPFSTMMERSQVLTAVRHGVVPQKALQQYPVEMALVLRMTAVDPAERPTTEEIIDQISSLVAASNQQSAVTALDELRELQSRLANAVHQLRERSQVKVQLEALISELGDKVQNVGVALA